MGWIWQEGKSGEKGAGKGKSQSGKAGKGKAGKPATEAPAGKGGSKKVYIYCSTPDCKGRVFMGTQPLPEKCKICHHCDVPFVFPKLGKGGNGQGREPKPPRDRGTTDTPSAAITTAYDELIAIGMTSEKAYAVLQGLGHTVPKPAAPRQPTDAYAKISKLNSEIATMQNIIEQKKEKHVRLSDDLSTLFSDIKDREAAVAELISIRTTQMSELPTTSLFPTVNVKPPEVATYLKGVEADWQRLIEYGNAFEVPEGQEPFSTQFSSLRDRTLQACKLQHEHVAFPTGSLGADAAELISEEGTDGGCEDDSEFPYDYLDPSTATSSHFPDLNSVDSRQEENKRQGLTLARQRKKPRASS